MPLTVKKLAKMSGVSVRTLHFYDEIGLLKPAYVADNGYRYYEEEQLFRLQQILFFKEFGFELKQIEDIVTQADFDQAQALLAHREVLLSKKKRLTQLIKTLEQTIKRLNGEMIMKDKDMFKGFSPEQQADYEAYLVNRYGDQVEKHIAEAKANADSWSKLKNEQAFQEWESICLELALRMAEEKTTHSNEVQAIIKRHHRWIKQFWTPDHDSYIGLGVGYCAFEWKEAFQNFDEHHPKLALFMAQAIKVFADHNLK